MNNTQLTEAQICDLRNQGLLESSEFAYKAGDLIIAEDPVSGKKRVIGQSSIIVENSKRILKG